MDRQDSDTPSWQRKFLNKYISASLKVSDTRSKLDSLPVKETRRNARKDGRPNLYRSETLAALQEDDEQEAVREWAASVAVQDSADTVTSRRRSSSTVKIKRRGRAPSIFTLRRGSSSYSFRSRILSVVGSKSP